MQTLLIGTLSVLCLFASPVQAEEEAMPLPFPVTLGGQAATAKKGEPFARIEKPVANNAEIVVTSKGDTIIINVAKAREDGTEDDQAAPAVILLQGTRKGNLDKTMDGKKLGAGVYYLTVVADNNTASIKFTIQ
jgi:hypothetical protein